MAKRGSKEGGNNRVKPTETELKEKLVNLNRVAKVTKGWTYVQLCSDCSGW